MKKVLSFIIAICMIIISVPISASATGACTTYSGDNLEDQNYSAWTSPTKSYLSECSNGRLMRIQAGNSISGVLIEYYDTSYKLLSSKLLPQELPIFGGFYESDSNYFLVTGQTNREELSTTEVYRLTKYDKSWNRISSVGVYNANTTVPFDAGTARMVMSGNVMIIYTSHEMYKAPDGYNHQANVIISIDTATMKLIRCQAGVLNTSRGYVSHSFNQFVQLDGKNMVTIDHGDAHPRSIVLIKHGTDVSTGSFGSNCTVKDVLTFPGSIGDNYTGASVGGFEISSSSYLVAGNTVAHDANYRYNRTRNIFVASVTGSKTRINQITNYAEGEKTASTPHFVKIGTDRYMLLWSRDNVVYYTTIDAWGNKTSSVYSMSGNLSDCAPIVVNNKLVWYVWNNSKNTFYEINLKSISNNNAVTVETGHKFELESTSNGVATVRCSNCGETNNFAVPTSMRLWWKTSSNTDGYYYSRINGELLSGEALNFMIQYSPTDSNENDEFEVIVSDNSILHYEPEYAYSGSFLGKLNLLKAGNATVTFKHKYNPALTSTFNLTVKSGFDITSVSLDKSSLDLTVGDQYTLKPIIDPANAIALCSWSSSDTAVATVDSNGAVVAKKAGKAVITLTLHNNLKATCTVKVKGDIISGDVTGNGKVDLTDVIFVLKHCVGISELSAEKIKRGDINDSGDITVLDALLIQKQILDMAWYWQIIVC